MGELRRRRGDERKKRRIREIVGKKELGVKI